MAEASLMATIPGVPPPLVPDGDGDESAAFSSPQLRRSKRKQSKKRLKYSGDSFEPKHLAVPMAMSNGYGVSSGDSSEFTDDDSADLLHDTDEDGSQSSPPRVEPIDSSGTHRIPSSENSNTFAKIKESFLTIFSGPSDEQFHELFPSVPADETLLDDFQCALQRDILMHGRMYVTARSMCFYSKVFKWETTLVVPWTDVRAMRKEKIAFVIPNAILIETATSRHLFASFMQRDLAFRCLDLLWQNAKRTPPLSVEELMDGMTVDWKRVSEFPPGTSSLPKFHRMTPRPRLPSTGESAVQESPQESAPSGALDFVAAALLASVAAVPTTPAAAPTTAAAASAAAASAAAASAASAASAAVPGTPDRISPQASATSTMRGSAPGTPAPPTPSSAAAPTLPNVVVSGGEEPAPLDEAPHGDDVSLDAVSLDAVSIAPTAEPVDAVAGPVECGCADHPGRQYIDMEVACDVDVLYQLLFTDSEFFRELYRQRNMQDTVLTGWTAGAGGTVERTLTYSIALNQSIGPKRTVAQERQVRMRGESQRLYCVDTEVTTPKVPYGDNFFTVSHYCMTRRSDTLSHLRVSSEVRYRKGAPWARSFIENATFEGLRAYWSALSSLLTAFLATHDMHAMYPALSRPTPAPSAPPRHSRRRCATHNRSNCTTCGRHRRSASEAHRLREQQQQQQQQQQPQVAQVEVQETLSPVPPASAMERAPSPALQLRHSRLPRFCHKDAVILSGAVALGVLVVVVALLSLRVHTLEGQLAVIARHGGFAPMPVPLSKELPDMEDAESWRNLFAAQWHMHEAQRDRWSTLAQSLDTLLAQVKAAAAHEAPPNPGPIDKVATAPACKAADCTP